MADTVEQLWKDQTLQEKLYPITKESAVVDDNNVSLDTKIASKLEGVKVNGTALPIVNKTVDVIINNGTLTIKKNDVTIGTFSANQSTNTSINIPADENIIEVVKVNGTALTITDKAVNVIIPVTNVTMSGEPPIRYAVLTLSDGTTMNVPILNNSTIKPYNLPNATDVVKGAVVVDTAMSDSSTNPVQNSVVKDYIDNLSGGLTNDIKVALLNCFQKVAWIDGNGQTYYDALEDALYPPANLVSISAVYTQSGTVYDNQTLDSLKSDLVVTAHWDNQTTTTVTDYTLSGTLVEGISTITVAYGGMTTTFIVNVTADQTYTESTSTLVTGTDWTYNAGKLKLADGTVDSSTTTWNTSEMIQIPSGTTSYAISANSAINNDYAIVWFDSEQAYIGSGISGTYSGTGTYGGGYTADGLCWNSVPVTASYCKLSWKNTHTVTSVSFRHNIKLDENITPVYNKIYYYTYNSSTIASDITNDDFLPCSGMAYAQIRPILQRSITFYDEDYIKVSQITRATNIGNNAVVPANAVYMKCQNTNRIASNANTTTLLGTGLIEFTETTLSEW